MRIRYVVMVAFVCTLLIGIGSCTITDLSTAEERNAIRAVLGLRPLNAIHPPTILSFGPRKLRPRRSKLHQMSDSRRFIIKFPAEIFRAFLESHSAQGVDAPLKDRYTRISYLGKGSFGEVWKSRNDATGEVVAVKIIRKHGSRLLYRRERHALRAVNGHPNIVRVHSLCKDARNYKIVMEHLAGGSLYIFIEENGCLSEDDAIHVMRGMISAVRHCHNSNIAHLDIKPGNFCIRRPIRDFNDLPLTQSDIVMIDFGLSVDISDPGFYDRDLCAVGTPNYTPSERYSSCSAAMLKSSDVYALGQTLLDMVRLSPIGADAFEGLSPRMKSTIKCMTDDDWRCRLTLDQAEHLLSS